MDIIFKTMFGSHLYGTNTEDSDIDFKIIYAPTKKQLITGKVKPFSSIHKSNKNDKHDKSDSSIIEEEYITLQQFLNLAMEGQTVAIDILFAPENFWRGKISNFWIEEIIPNRELFLSKKLNKFVQYCVKQAAKYGIKGSRINTVKTYIKFFENHKNETKLINIVDQLKYMSNIDHSYLILNDKPHESILKICGKKFLLSVKIKHVLPSLYHFLDTYGKRAEQASKDQGVDKKACSHAFRAAFEVKELVETRNLIFPLKDREFLKDIKTGKLTYSEFAPMLEDLVDEVEDLVNNSDLPDKPLINFDKTVLKYYEE